MAQRPKYELADLFKGFALFLLLIAAAILSLEVSLTFVGSIPSPLRFIVAFGLFIYALAKLLKPFRVTVNG